MYLVSHLNETNFNVLFVLCVCVDVCMFVNVCVLQPIIHLFYSCLQHMWMFVDDCMDDNVDLGPVGRVDGPLDTPTCSDAMKLIKGTNL